MKNYAKKTRDCLYSAINSAAQESQQFVRNPGKDFTRTRKLSFQKTISILLGLEGGSLSNELLRYFVSEKDMPSTSAFVQQRRKILPEALEFIFHNFTDSLRQHKFYRNYRLLAADGSDMQIPLDKTDPETCYPGEVGKKPYSITKLNAIYDLCSHIYVDALVQGKRVCNENRVLCKMVDRSRIEAPVILLADRGYESYNTMAHLQRKEWKYLIRAREHYGVVRALELPEQDEFDLKVDLMLTRKQTKEMKLLLEDHNHYRFIPATLYFDLLPPHGNELFYELHFRVVRFQISDGVYETIITNLAQEEFPASELKELYAMRWGIETSFRTLKYTMGLLHFHAKKVELIIQEIFARLIMYNFTAMITSHMIIQDKHRKYAYKANFSAAVPICRQLFRGNVSPPQAETLLSRFISPIRPGRSMPRKLNPKEPVSFTYRVA